MDFYSQIVACYPKLTIEDFSNGIIELRDDGDGVQYIYLWNYDQPLPKGMKIGK